MTRRSLTFRLVSWYCGLLLAAGGAFAVFTYVNFDRYNTEDTRSTLSARATAVWGMSRDILNDRDRLADLIERRFAPEAQNRFIRITGDGLTYYRSGAPVEKTFDPDSLPLPDSRGSSMMRLQDLFLYSASFTTPDGRTITVESGQSADLLQNAEQRLVVSLAIGLPLLLLIAAGGGYVLVQRALSPVEAMIAAAEALTFNSPQKRLPLAGAEDRIDALGRTLNRMLERLDAAYQHTSRFSADAAHELRTPLAIMHGELDLLAADRTLPPSLQGGITNILTETGRLSQIVADLIALSQLDSVSGKRTHQAVDLRALAAETIDHIRLLADDKEISITLDAGRAVAAGDRNRLKQVLVNLLDNAIKYTPIGGQIDVAMSEIADTAILEVRDTGVGIPAEHLPHVFDRFYRVSTDRGEVGSGLGLAIVRAICAAHGGRVAVESQAGIGSTFRVELPRATDALATRTEEEPRQIGPKAA